jgi:hypothetical protein
MKINLSEILKQQGLFSQDIKTRINNKQIFINGCLVSEDVEIDCAMVKNTKKDVTGKEFGNEIVDFIDAGDFLFDLISNRNWLLKIQMFGFENLFDTNIKNDLTLFLKSFILLKISKKQILVLKRAI